MPDEKQHMEAAALKIDPSTAEVKWEDGSSGSRVFFARAPMSDVWVSFDDLPDETAKALWRKIYEEDPLVPPWPDDWGRSVETLIRMAEEYPELFGDLDELIENVDRMVEEVPDETLKARWRSRRSRLEKLHEVLRRGAAGLRLDG